MPHNPDVCPTEAEFLELYPVFKATPYTEGFNAFTATVGSAAVGPYILTVDAAPFVYAAVGGDTVTIIRDMLLAVITATPNPNYIATGSGIDAIVLTSLIDGRGLPVATNGGPGGTEMTVAETTALTTTDIVHQALEFAGCLVCEWGCNTWNGCLSAAVHWLKLWRSGQTTTTGASGQVTSMTQGPFSVSFATTAMSSGADGWWGGTPEGLQFLFLRRQQGPRPISLHGGQACQFGFSRGVFGDRFVPRRHF